ncbi:MAG TPA: class I SAM-dependent methyltransferase [Bryobacteraceae bacterium]|nr:class I SAM-dependent methyltransferase [Bryobacteraceae bacterium]
MTGAERTYYSQRAAEYDDFYLGTGLFAQRPRPGWHEELARLQALLASLRFDSVLDIACGTGFLTESLRGKVTGIDQSAAMLAIARSRLPGALLVRGDALELPFRAKQFEGLVAAHFYGHLDEAARSRFLEGARRVAKSLVIIDAAKREEVPAEEHQRRVLKDGSRHVVYKRYFTAQQLIDEAGTGRTLQTGRWFVAVQV